MRKWPIAWLLIGLCGAGCSPEQPAAPARVEALSGAELLADPRVADLLSTARSEPFLEDTSNLLPALASKLEFALAEPLHAAKRELSALGAAALPEVTRIFERNADDPQKTPRAVNAMEVAARMPDGVARALLLRGLIHPSSSVRLAALRGLRSAATPADFDTLVAQGPLTGADSYGELAAALWQCDKLRVVKSMPTWVENRAIPPLVLLALGPRLAEIEDPEALEALRGLAPRLEGELRARVWAALARRGDSAALGGLRAWLSDPEVPRRELAAHCLRDAGLQLELVERLRIDGHVPIRKLAAQALSEIELDAEMLSVLEQALGDPSEEVRGVALGALVRKGVPVAENEALELLRGERPELERALVVLREPMLARPELAARVLAVLQGLEEGTIGPLRVERAALWRAIAQVPTRAAAEHLYACAGTQPSPSQGISAHQWFVTQLGNCGAPGRELARERWRAETDPQRRMDLLMVSCFEADDAAREFLLQAFESRRMSAPEQLHAAFSLARIGPATVVAPFLKRVALEIDHPRVRPSFNNLLWSWYGLYR
jgi:hypothetical protein